MSSRSFRRRNNRRKHNGPPGAADAARQGQTPGGQEDRGGEGGGGQNKFNGRGRDNRPGRHGGGERGRDHSRRGQGAEAPVQRAEPPVVFPDCPICNQPVRDLPSALTHRGTGRPAHFDCIMREIRDSNELTPQERVCYLGGGTFGILEFRQPGGPGKFVIRKRIQYEEKEASQEWKKPLLISL